MNANEIIKNEEKIAGNISLTKIICKADSPRNINSEPLKISKIYETRLSRLSAILQSDLIRDVYLEKTQQLEKFQSFLTYFLLPNIIALVNGIILMFFFEYSFFQECFLPPNCLCDDFTSKLVSALKEYLTAWLNWILVFCLNEKYNKYYRISLFWLASLIVLCFHLLSTAQTFVRYPLFILLVSINVISSYIFSKKTKVRSKLYQVFRDNGFYFVILSNYFLLMIADSLKLSMGKFYFSLALNIYVPVFFELIEKSLLFFGKGLCDKNNILNENYRVYFICNCRISFGFLFSFLTDPISKLSFYGNEIIDYSILITYSNSLFALYTRKNIILIMVKKIISIIIFLIFKKKINFKDSNDETEVYLSKKIAGATLDIVFISSTHILIMLLWQKMINHTKCREEIMQMFKIFGLFGFVFINISLTLFVFIYMLKERKKFFSYPIWNNLYLNSFGLLLIRTLYENSLGSTMARLNITTY